MIRGILIGLFLLTARAASACDCAQLSFEERLKASDVVFLASVKNYVPLTSIELQVIERFKGRIKDKVVIQTGKSDCDYFVPPVQATRGDRFLVFATLREKEVTVSRCLGSGPEVESTQDLAKLRKNDGDLRWVKGRWIKDFFLEGKNKYPSPDWQLVVFFGDEEFSYVSTNPLVVHLTNGQTKRMDQRVEVNGKWSATKTGRIVIRFDRDLSSEEISHLRTNLNFSPERGTAEVQIDFIDGHLRLMGGERGREIHFSRAERR